MEQISIEIKKVLAELQVMKSEINELKELIIELKKQHSEAELAAYFSEWIPRKKLMEYLEYGDTQIAALFKKEKLKVSEIGIRKFIKKESVLQMLERNLKK